MPVPLEVFVFALPFCVWDVQFAVALVSTGCAVLVKSHHQRHRAAARVQSERLSALQHALRGGAAVVGGAGVGSRLLDYLFRFYHELLGPFDNLPRGGGGRQQQGALFPLPGMSDHNPLDATEVNWGNAFPRSNGTGAPIPVEWLASETFSFQSGLTMGRLLIGVAATRGAGVASGLVVVSAGFLLVSPSLGSPVFFTFSFLLLADDSGGSFDAGPRLASRLQDVYWHLDVCADRVSVLRHVQLQESASASWPCVHDGDDALVSSHPALFGKWFTAIGVDSSTQQSVCDRVNVASIRPFSLLAVTYAPEVQPLGLHLDSLLQLAARSQTVESFLTHIDTHHLQPVTELVAAHQEDVFTVQEEHGQMVTPKGVWTYPTGKALTHRVDALATWVQRRQRLMLQWRRAVSKGAMDLFRCGWIPIGLLASLR